MDIRLAGIVSESIVDGPGLRMAVFCQGCPHNCKGCHNPETHDFEGGSIYSTDKIIEIFNKNPLLSGITFSGGEPMCQPEAFAEICKAVKAAGKTVTVFSGFTLNQLLAIAKGQSKGWEFTDSQRRALAYLIMNIDILIDGPFVLDKRDLTLEFRGSSNQRVIDMNKTRQEGKIVLWQ